MLLMVANLNISDFSTRIIDDFYYIFIVSNVLIKAWKRYIFFTFRSLK